MLFSRYHGETEHIMLMPYEDGIEIISYAYEKRADEQLYHRWLSNYERVMSFSEFKDKLGVKTDYSTQSNKTKEEILESVKRIIG